MEDITGQKFNKLTAINYSHKLASGDIYWNFKCDCGKSKVILKGHVKSGKTKSCGCYSMTKDDITGNTYGMLTAIKFLYIKDHRAFWLFLCECGEYKETMKQSVKSGDTKSCGCSSRSMMIEKVKKHGKSGTPIYEAWRNMLQRCYYKKSISFKNYGGRGIVVSKEWHDFNIFYKDMGDPPFSGASIDRKNVNGNYEKANCRWATTKQQARNKRENVIIKYQGVELCLSEWADIYNLKRGTLKRRIDLGWDIGDALNKPISKIHRNATNKLRLP
jgi:hypothetical protein